jgi:hypothetical protein
VGGGGARTPGPAGRWLQAAEDVAEGSDGGVGDLVAHGTDDRAREGDAEQADQDGVADLDVVLLDAEEDDDPEDEDRDDAGADRSAAGLGLDLLRVDAVGRRGVGVLDRAAPEPSRG